MSDNKKKIILLYSTAGLGHKKAAMALLKAFRAREDVKCEMVNVLDYGNRFCCFVYEALYVFFMTRARWLWGALYHLSNNTVADVITRKLRGIIDYHSLPGLGEVLVKKAPDAIVATHFFLPSIADILMKNKAFYSRMFAVITDYGPHTYWLSRAIDRFFVGSASASEELAKRGVPEDKITVSGIPTTDDFCGEFDTEDLRRTYRLDKDRKTIFLMSGGFGVGPMEKMLFSLNECKVEIQVIAVCGHNKEVYEDIELIRDKLRYPLVLFGFTDKVAELMAVSDIMVTKAGGISVTEALNMRLPMVFYASVPGQETWNEDLLVRVGAAQKADNVRDIPVIVNRMLLSEDAYETFIEGIDKVRRPHAAEHIVDMVLKDIE